MNCAALSIPASYAQVQDTCAQLKQEILANPEEHEKIASRLLNLIKTIPDVYGTERNLGYMRPIKSITNTCPVVQSSVVRALLASRKPGCRLIGREIEKATPLEWVEYTEESWQQIVENERILSQLQPTLALLSHLGDRPFEVAFICVEEEEQRGAVTYLLEESRIHTVVRAESWQSYRLNPSIRSLLCGSSNGFSNAVECVIQKARPLLRSLTDVSGDLSDLFCHLESLRNSEYFETLDASHQAMLDYAFGCAAFADQKYERALSAFRSVFTHDCDQLSDEVKELIFPEIHFSLAMAATQTGDNAVVLGYLERAETGYLERLSICLAEQGHESALAQVINTKIRFIGEMRQKIQKAES